MKQMFRHPRIDWKTIDQKKLFLAMLKADPFNFGHITSEERMNFLNFAIEVGILKFIGSQEYRGILSQYKILADFGCTFDREGIDKYHSTGQAGRHWLSLRKGEFLEFTESIMERGRIHEGQPRTHVIYVYVSDEERAKIYDI